MSAKKPYKNYFHIFEKYFPQVTEALIAKGEVSWKNYFANDSFINALTELCDMVTGKKPLSMFLWGPYGSGKSHLLLTIMCMLEAPDSEIVEYFEEQKLSKDLMNRFIAAKNSGKILTIHRIGSANIQTETDLVIAVQQSVMAALNAKGFENQGEASMKDSFLDYIAKPINRNYFAEVIKQQEYIFTFSGKSVDDIEKTVKSDDIEASEDMTRKVMKVLKDIGQIGILKDADAMSDWIIDIIEKNDLKAILFAWDEFSEFLNNHPNGLTGFQTLAEVSNSHPFYFIVVSHEADRVFADKKAASKILDRFQKPVEISLPENTAFKLMARAMRITSDAIHSKEWETKILPQLNEELSEARKKIITINRNTRGGKEIYSQFSEEDLKGVAPIHPFAALIMRQLASMFNSNQRSMFDFIISDNEETKGFKWFINEYGPFEETHILTVDMLWDFFCGKQIAGLSNDVRGIFLNYDGLKSDQLLPEEQRVIKTILILQATAVRISNDLLLSPNDEALELAFSGTDWSKGRAISIAKGLIDKNLIFVKPMANGKNEYCVANGNPVNDIKKFEEQAANETKTSILINKGNLAETVAVPKSVEMRYDVEYTCESGFTVALNNHARKNLIERVKVVVTFAIDDAEAERIRKQILKSVTQANNDIIFIETLTPMGNDLREQYKKALTFSYSFMKADKDQAKHYQDQAEQILRQWCQRISSGAFNVYTPDNKNGERKANLSDLHDFLKQYDRQLYPCCLEQYTLNSTLYTAYNLAQGAELGIKQEVKGAFLTSNKNLSIENALIGAWGVKNYWEDNSKQSLVIVKVKKRIDEIITKSFESNNGEVSIISLFEEMEKPPFGFMPNSITAYVMGYCLSNYATPNYFWSNHSDNTPMSVDKMKTMIANALNQRINAVKNYKEEYIVTMTPQTREFLKCSAMIFKIPETQCVSIPDTRNQIRIKMKGYQFPVWCVKHLLDNETLVSTKELVIDVIDCYTGIANTANSNKGTESSLAEKIGQICIDNPKVVDDLKRLVCDEKCRDGMIAYIGQFKNGELVQLAAEINDGGEYIEEVRKKFSASDGNWVWSVQTADEKIDNVILEYKIIKESNKSFSNCSSLSEVIGEWNRKTNNIKIPCEIAAKQVGDLGVLLWLLYSVKKNNNIAEQEKQNFYDTLCAQREAFDEFYKNQIQYFKSDARSFLTELDDVEIDEIFGSLPQGQFTKSKNEYYNYIQQAIEEHNRSQLKKKMQTMWHEKTHTKNPLDWSDKYNTPILCMVSDDKRSIARTMFDIIKSVNPSEDDAKKAIEFMENADFFDVLDNEEERDKLFMKLIVGTNSVLLNDVNKIRDALRSKLPHEHPYYWFGNPTVQNCLKTLVDKEYKLKGSEKAAQIIDEMSTEQLREYLKRRIEDDMEFGIQILKGEV